MSDQTNPIQNPAEETNKTSETGSLTNALNNALNFITGSDTDSDEETRYISHIPKSDFPALVLAKLVAERWKGSRLTLEYTNVDDYLLLLDEYEVALSKGRSAKAERTPTVDRLKHLRESIDKNLGKIKNMLNIDYGRISAPSHYPNFGIEKLNNGYGIPLGYDETVRALNTLLTGLDKYGYADHKFGRAFWQPIYDEYVELATKNRALTGSGSAHSGDKNVLKEQVTAVLRSVLLLLQANYPEKWQTVAREWGYLRERY